MCWGVRGAGGCAMWGEGGPVGSKGARSSTDI